MLEAETESCAMYVQCMQMYVLQTEYLFLSYTGNATEVFAAFYQNFFIL
jgi:hypothetical protein